MIVTADLHFSEATEGTICGEVLPGLAAKAGEDPDRVIAILGDFWHVRYRVVARLQNAVALWLEALSAINISVILLPGNHDLITTEGENALEVFQAYSNVLVRTEPAYDQFGFWLPYRVDQRVLSEFLVAPSVLPSRVLWAHLGVRGARKSAAFVDEDGLPVDLFSGWEAVYCGHYHEQQTLGKINYIGSPYQTRADEAGQKKFIGQWIKGNGLSLIPVRWGPRYHRLHVGPASNYLLPKPEEDVVRQGDHVHVVVEGGDLDKILAQLRSLGIENTVVTPVVEAPKERLAMRPGAQLEEYVVAYLGQYAGYHDKQELINIYRNLVGSAS